MRQEPYPSIMHYSDRGRLVSLKLDSVANVEYIAVAAVAMAPSFNT